MVPANSLPSFLVYYPPAHLDRGTLQQDAHEYLPWQTPAVERKAICLTFPPWSALAALLAAEWSYRSTSNGTTQRGRVTRPKSLSEQLTRMGGVVDSPRYLLNMLGPMTLAASLDLEHWPRSRQSAGG